MLFDRNLGETNRPGHHSIIMSEGWQQTNWRNSLISAPARCWLPFTSPLSAISSDYWHYGKFAVDNQPHIPAKFLITPLEMSLGLWICINVWEVGGCFPGKWKGAVNLRERVSQRELTPHRLDARQVQSWADPLPHRGPLLNNYPSYFIMAYWQGMITRGSWRSARLADSLTTPTDPATGLSQAVEEKPVWCSSSSIRDWIVLKMCKNPKLGASVSSR